MSRRSLLDSAVTHDAAATFHESPNFWGNCAMTPEEHRARARELRRLADAVPLVDDDRKAALIRSMDSGAWNDSEWTRRKP